jgi:hypothetical protein
MVNDDDNSGVGVGGSPEAIAVNQDTNTVCAYTNTYTVPSFERGLHLRAKF